MYASIESYLFSHSYSGEEVTSINSIKYCKYLCSCDKCVFKILFWYLLY
jgi:hypothetical protein